MDRNNLEFAANILLDLLSGSASDAEIRLIVAVLSDLSRSDEPCSPVQTVRSH